MVVSIFLFNLIKTLQNLPRPLTHFTDVDTEVERLNDSAQITQLVLAKEIIRGCSKWNTFCHALPFTGILHALWLTGSFRGVIVPSLCRKLLRLRDCHVAKVIQPIR